MAAKLKLKSKSRDLEGEFLKAWRASEPKIEPVTQLRFAKRLGRLWKFDVAFVPHRIAVELDGAVFSGGRHSRGIGMTNDNQKINAAQLLGWRVYRFTVKDFESPEAIKRMIDIVSLAVYHAPAGSISPDLFPVRKAKKKSRKASDPLPGYGVNLSALGLKQQNRTR